MTIINKNEISRLLETSQEAIINVIDPWLSEGSGQTITDIIGHFNNITKYKPTT